MKLTRSLPTAGVLLLAAACESFDAPVGPQAEGPAGSRAPALPANAQERTPDHEFARISRTEVPGFAGFYLQEDGTPVIRLTDPRQRGAAQRFVATQLAGARSGRHAAGASRAPIFRDAEHDFATLVEWSEGLHPLLQRPDVYLIDVDEKENRVSVGVADQTAIGAVRSEGARLGMPAGALHVFTQEAPRQRATVRDWHSNLRGGIQIAFGNYVCTYGFNAKHNGVPIFVTNSHCTNSYFAYDGGPIYQNTVSSANLIGYESADRGLYACAGSGTWCRLADAAYIRHTSGRTIGQGLIAETPWASGGPGGLTIIGDFRIVARYTGAVVYGTPFDKTGRTTGSTYGYVTNSCVTIGNLRCQDVSTVYSMGGDSGSPIHVWQGGSDTHLHGILWGGPGTNYNVTYSSRLSGIEADLGTLTDLCVPGAGC